MQEMYHLDHQVVESTVEHLRTYRGTIKSRWLRQVTELPKLVIGGSYANLHRRRGSARSRECVHLPSAEGRRMPTGGVSSTERESVNLRPAYSP